MDSPPRYFIQRQSILQITGQVQSSPLKFILTVLTHTDFPLFQIHYILISITQCSCFLFFVFYFECVISFTHQNNLKRQEWISHILQMGLEDIK